MKRRFGRLGHLVSITAAVGVGSMIAACSQGEPPVPPSGPDPIVKAAHAPPPISGGTLLVATRTNPNLAVVSDTDRDKVWVVELSTGVPVAHVDLKENDEPGRIVEDTHGQVHVALRRGGDLATIDLQTMHVDRRHVCAAPRGVAYDKVNDAVHVACMNGELVTLPATGGGATRTLQLERDLQDVLVQGDDLVISKFRSAELIVLGTDGAIKSRTSPPVVKSSRMRQMGVHETFSPDQAWRTINMPDGRIAMVHQRALDSEVVIHEAASSGDSYGGGGTTPGCDPTIVHSTVTLFDKAHLSASPTNGTPAIPNTLLPVDIAAHADARGNVELSIVAAADNRVVTITPHALEAATGPNTNCDDGDDGQPVNGEPVALAYWNDKIVVQTRDPIALTVLGTNTPQIILPGADTKDTGHDMFHRNDGGSVRLACASCHGQGRDDGHVWNFNIGPRRTQNIANDVLTTAPFHWDGKMKDMGMIMHEVFEKRMGGRPQGPAHVDAFQTWISKLPAMSNPVVGNSDQIEAGKELFQGKAQCNGCHTGLKLTNNQNKAVGTGKINANPPQTFQVPSLIGVVMRAPYMHDGCAKTLKERFTNDVTCTGGDQHGKISALTASEIDDLVAYLESL